MFKVIIFAFVATAVVSAFEIVQDEEGQEFYLVPVEPHHRERRQTSIGVSGGPGVRVTAGHQGTILNRDGHKLDGNGFISKQFRPTGPTTLGGGLNYQHLPSGSNLNIGAQHTPRYGTDLSATGTANIWRRGNTRLDAVGSYDRHFGGPGGTGRPNYYGGLNFEHRF